MTSGKPNPGAAAVIRAAQPERLWARIIVIAAIELGLLLAEQALGTVTGADLAVRPAAAFGLAALLLCGPRAWPGIWIGALLAHLWLIGAKPGFSGLPTAMLLALAPTAQALLGVLLIRPLLQRREPLASGRNVVCLLLLGGPVACLAPAALSVGIQPPPGLGIGAWLEHWAELWTAHSAGVVLLTPVCLLAWPGALRSWVEHRWVHLGMPLVATALALSAAYVWWNAAEQASSEASVNARAERLFGAEREVFRNYLHHVRMIERHFAASETVTEHGFGVFVEHIVREAHVQAVEWIPRVTRERRTVFERAEDTTADPATITELDARGKLVPAADRPEYFPVHYVRPLAPNGVVRGFDLGADPQRRAALQRACDRAEIVVTPPVLLLQNGRLGSLVFAPVYHRGFDPAAATVAARRGALRGFVLVVLDLETLAAHIARKADAAWFGYRLSDVTAGEPARVLGSTATGERALRWAREIAFADRTWRLELEHRPLAAAHHAELLHTVLHTVVLLIALFMSCALLSSVGNARRLRAAARLNEATLNALSAHLAILDEHGVILFANRAWRNFAPVSGVERAQLGPGVSYLAACDAAAPQSEDAAATARAIRALIEGQENEIVFDHAREAPGTDSWYQCRVNRFSDAGEARIVVVHEDVTAQKQAQHQAIAEAARARALAQAGRRIGEVLDEAQVLHVACEETAAALGVPISMVMLQDEGSEELCHEAAVGLPAEYRAQYVRPSRDYVQSFPRDSDGVSVIPDVRAHPGNPNRALHQRHRMCTMLSAPMRRGERMLGALVVFTLDAPRAFGDEERALLRGLAELTAIAVEKTRLLGELKQELAQRSAAEQRFRAIFDSAFQAVALMTPDGTLLEVNAAMRDAAGLDGDGTRVAHLWQIPRWRQDPSAEERLRSAVRDAADGQFVRYEVPLGSGDEAVVLDFSVKPRRNADGVVTLLVAEGRDITERTRAREELRASEARLREVQHLAQIGGWELELSPSRLYWCEEVYRIFERAPEHFTVSMASFLAAVHPEDREAVSRASQRLLRRGETFDIEHRLLMPDGRVKWVHERGELLGDANGRAPRAIGSVQDITERKRAELALQTLTVDLERRVETRTQELQVASTLARAKGEELQALVNNLSECVITTNGKGVILSANAATETVFGHTPAALLGQSIGELLPDSHALRRRLASPLTPQAMFEGNVLELEGRHKDGQSIPLELGLSRYIVDGERYFTGILRDVSERNRFVSELDQARERAEAANRAKSDFLAAMSHEIRTPMNGVIGMADLLARDGTLPGEQSERVEVLRDSAYSLLRIIDDILDFSKIEAGRLEIEQVPVSVAELVTGVCNTLEPVAASRNVRLIRFVDPRLPAQILGDPTRLRQVLYNLVGNAIKFSSGRKEKPGRVEVRAVRESGDPMRITFSVADNGIGMTPETLERVFEPFTQAESSTTRRFGGTGLGLAVAVRLADLMQGRLGAESTPGEGAVFRFSLPVPGESTAPSPPHDLTGLDCIVAGSSLLDAADLGAYLEHGGARVHVAPDAPAAASRAAALGDAPVVVLDLPGHGPDADAVERALEAFPSARLLFLGRGRRSSARALSAQAVALDADQLDMPALLHAVALVTGRAAPEPAARAGETPATDMAGSECEHAPSVESARAEGRLILVAEDHAMNRKVIAQQLAQLGHAAEIVEDGIEALQRVRAGRPGLLLTDLHMPRMDGYELARAIRAEEPRGARLPIIALSANALVGEAGRCRAAGMDAYLSKPARLDQLEEMLRQWLPAPDSSAGDASTRALDSEQAGRGEPGADGPVVQLDVLRALVGDDPGTVHEFLGDYLDSAEHSAQELRGAWAARDLPAVAGAAHKLKSAARTVGAEQLGALCAALEETGKRGESEALAPLVAGFDAALESVESEVRRILEQGKQMPESAA